MPTLEFKGKQYIYSHHHSVPFRELLVDGKKSLPASGKKPSLDDNLIIHGDNLHALKALMPQYAGKIKCIYIDPPYNTGNEGWCYNDNVNSPLMKEWLKKNANPVDKEDMERHDKWLCMMYPRLKLLHELLADDGVIFVSIDDNEVANLRLIMDEIFDDSNFVANILWQKKYAVANDHKCIAPMHDHILVFRKTENWERKLLPRTAEKDRQYRLEDAKGIFRADNYTCNKSADERPNLFYPIIQPNTGEEIWPKRTAVWRYSKERHAQNVEEDMVYWGKDGTGKTPAYKRYLDSLKNGGGIVPQTWWTHEFCGHTDAAKKEIRAIMVHGDGIGDFITPKPSLLIERILQLSTDKNAIILDSFAGSGTTAHAILALNKEDGGNRKFILVEMEDYADTITAERVRRVIKGMPTAKDENLKAGLGGSFTFCELGKEISIEKIITGELIPAYGALAQYVFYTATGKSLDKEAKEKPDYFVGETDLYEVYLIYKPDIAFLRSNDSALNDIKLKAIADRHSKKEKLVFATAKYMGQKELSAQNITFCQLPYAIHKVVRA
ncbi:MAG: site-specific DNA-methyltransferase [Methylobacter sp.]|nr:site-specific DNA-methyltransferase [Methylobacter sp.]